MELLSELKTMGHDVTKWELSLQWSQESAFPEKKLEVKKVWTYRLYDLIEKNSIEMTISDACTALESFQIVTNGPTTESHMLASPIKHCLLWLNSPCGWNAGRATTLASQKIFEAKNLFHIACSPEIKWELENIFAIPPEQIIDSPFPVSIPQQEITPDKDIVFLSKTTIPQDIMPLIACAAEGHTESTVQACVFYMKRLFSAISKNILPSVQTDFIDFYTAYLEAIKTDPFTDLCGFMAQNQKSIINLLFFFQLCPEHFAQILNIEEAFKVALDVLAVSKLKKEFNCFVSAPDSWNQAGIKTNANTNYQSADALFASARICVSMPHKVHSSPLCPHTFKAMAAPTALVCSKYAPCTKIFTDEILVADNPDDIINKTRSLLDNEDKRVQIMHSGLSNVKSNHTWNNCLNRMFKKWT